MKLTDEELLRDYKNYLGKVVYQIVPAHQGDWFSGTAYAQDPYLKEVHVNEIVIDSLGIQINNGPLDLIVLAKSDIYTDLAEAEEYLKYAFEARGEA